MATSSIATLYLLLIPAPFWSPFWNSSNGILDSTFGTWHYKNTTHYYIHLSTAPACAEQGNSSVALCLLDSSPQLERGSIRTACLPFYAVLSIGRIEYPIECAIERQVLVVVTHVFLSILEWQSIPPGCRRLPGVSARCWCSDLFLFHFVREVHLLYSTVTDRHF